MLVRISSGLVSFLHPLIFFVVDIFNEVEGTQVSVVYIQEENWKKGDLLVMNKDRTIKSHMAREGQEEVFDTIFRDCREKGFRGSAGFYMAVVEANEEEVIRLEVNPARMLSVEPWVCTDLT